MTSSSSFMLFFKKWWKQLLYIPLYLLLLSRIFVWKFDIANGTIPTYIMNALLFSSKINTIELGIFNALGLWPLVAIGFLNKTNKNAKYFTYPSFFLGMFCIFPFLIVFPKETISNLKQFNNNKKTPFERSNMYLLFIIITATILFVFACSGGLNAWKEFFFRFQTDGFVNTMSIDFFCFWICSLTWIIEEEEETSTDFSSFNFMKKNPFFFIIPLIGSASYLLWKNKPSLVNKHD